MGHDLLDKLTAYKVRPAPKNPPGKFETGTGNFEGMCGVLGALELIEWVGRPWERKMSRRDWRLQVLRFAQDKLNGAGGTGSAVAGITTRSRR